MRGLRATSGLITDTVVWACVCTHFTEPKTSRERAGAKDQKRTTSSSRLVNIPLCWKYAANVNKLPGQITTKLPVQKLDHLNNYYYFFHQFVNQIFTVHSRPFYIQNLNWIRRNFVENVRANAEGDVMRYIFILFYLPLVFPISKKTKILLLVKATLQIENWRYQLTVLCFSGHQRVIAGKIKCNL